MTDVELSLEYVLEVELAANSAANPCGASGPLSPKVAVGVCAAVGIFDPVMEVLVELLAPCPVALVAMDAESERVVESELTAGGRFEGGLLRGESKRTAEEGEG